MKIKYGKEKDLPLREAVRGVVLKDGKIGVVRFSKINAILFPGGGVDPNEDLEDALKREFLEETGYPIKVNKLVITTEYAERDWTHMNHFFTVEITGEQQPVSLTEQEKDLGLEFVWMTPSELYQYYIDEPDKDFYDEGEMVLQRGVRSRGFLLLTKLMWDEAEYLDLLKLWIGQEVEVIVDRPIGFHDYKINYGYIENRFSLDGQELDAYILGPKIPVKSYKAKVVGVVHRYDDNENKLVVANCDVTKEQIKEQINFREKFYNSILIK